MKGLNAVKKVAQSTLDPLETLSNQLKPLGEEAANELGGFFGAKKLPNVPQTLAAEDLRREREKQQLDKNMVEEQQESQNSAQNISEQIAVIRQEYSSFDQKKNNEQRGLKKELVELQGEVEGLAKASGINTKAHLEAVPKKVGALDIKWLTAIIRFLRIKTEESKSAKDMVSERSNAKKSTGMLAWVSGKQMKVHEQGTLQLQG